MRLGKKGQAVEGCASKRLGTALEGSRHLVLLDLGSSRTETPFLLSIHFKCYKHYLLNAKYNDSASEKALETGTRPVIVVRSLCWMSESPVHYGRGMGEGEGQGQL